MARKRRGRSEGSIYYREADNQWVGSISLGYSEDGRRKRRTVYGKTKQEVQEKLRALQHEEALGQLADVTTLTVAQWLARWLEAVKSQVAPKTHLRYEQLVRLRINPHIGGARLAKLAPVHVQGMFTALERLGVSARGRQMAGTMLHKALRDAVRLRLIASNPAAEVAKPRPQRAKMRAFDEQQSFRLLAAAASDRLYALFVLALDTGMRQGELFALQWEDFDFQGGPCWCSARWRNSTASTGSRSRSPVGAAASNCPRSRSKCCRNTASGCWPRAASTPRCSARPRGTGCASRTSCAASTDRS
jgi:integrase